MEGARSTLTPMRTDQELLAAYAATGDEPAFAELVARHGRMVYRTCLRSLGSEHDAEEAAQAVFLVLAHKARALRSEGELAAWLHRVARNVAHLAIRSRARRSRHEAEAAMVRPTESAPDDVGARHAVPLQDLDRELDALPAAQRQAVLLRYLEGLPQEEAARLAGCPQGTLARRAQIGLERLRQRLCQRGQVLSAAALAGLLGAEAVAAAPASLLPSILAASKLAAVGAAGAVGTVGAAGVAGAVGAQPPAFAAVAAASAEEAAAPLQLAEGVLKMMLWAKVKLAAAVAAAVLAVGGGGTAAIIAAAESPKAEAPKVESPNPGASASEKGIECRVTELVGGGKVKLSAGSAQGVKERFEFDVSRDGQPVGTVKVVAVEERQCTAEIAKVTGEIKVGDRAATRFREVAPAPPAKPENAKALVFTEKDNGKTVRVPVGQVFEIRLEGKEAGTGWEFPSLVGPDASPRARTSVSAKDGKIVPEKDDILVHERSDFTPAAGAADQAIGTYITCFRALRVGQATIQGDYVHPGGHGFSGARLKTVFRGEYKLTVEVFAAEPANEAVNGLKFTISADQPEAKAGEEVKLALNFENVSKEDFCIFHFWGETSWELVAPDGESLAPAPTTMPGLAPPTAKNYPELKSGGKLSWQEKSVSGNPPSVYVGPGINPRNVYLLKPGTYKLTAVYEVKEGQGKGVAPGKVWAGTVRSNTLEIKLGGEFKAPAQPAGWPWPPQGIPGVTPPQKGEKLPAGAPDEATARRLVLEHRAKVVGKDNVRPAHITNVDGTGDRWRVEYDPHVETMPPDVYFVDKKTGVVSQSRPGR
jgi:RNA polymerase sigma factor (sigma-70 family)